MMLEEKMRVQLNQLLESLTHPITIKASLNDDANSKDVRAFLNEMVQLSTKVTIEETNLERTPAFSVGRVGEESRVIFAGLPLGHEFESFLLALQQIDGQLPKIKKTIASRLEKIDRQIHFETYVSLSCRNCPSIVQSLNYLAIINPNITHTMIEGKMFYKERVEKNVFAVPTLFIDGVEVSSGRKSPEQLLDIATGRTDIDDFVSKGIFDVLVIGGGPAGNSATIYAARKGLKVGMIAESYGGKVKDISSIENMISIPYTEGPRLMDEIEIHANQYYVDMMKHQRVIGIKKENSLFEIKLENTAVLKTKTVIVAVGVTWKKLNIPGEEKLFAKGVSYCPHCDGPLFNEKEVALIGGGNQAVEGAIDLANKAKHVYILDRASQLEADKILQNRIEALPNVTVLLNADIQEVNGTDRVKGLTYLDQKANQKQTIDVDGIFVQIGLIPNTDWLVNSSIELNAKGEIIVDGQGMTSLPGVFAAGDCTNTAYKQIIISMGSGATAALGAFDYLIRQ